VKYYTLLTVLTYLAAMLGVAAVASSEREPVYLVITVVGCLLMWPNDRAGWRMPTPIRALVLAAALGYTLADVMFFAEYVTLTLSHLLVFATLVKLTTIKGPRDYLQVYVLALGGVIVGGYFASHFVYGAILVAFLFVCGWALMLLVMTGESQLWVRSRSSDYAPRILNRDRLAVVDQTIGVRRWRFLGRTGLYGPAVLIPAVLVFLLVPRGGRHRYGTPSAGGYQAITGFSEQIQLGEMARILEDPTPVMTVTLRHPVTQRPLDAPRVALLWRGITLDRYQKRSRKWGWEKSEKRSVRYERGLTMMDPKHYVRARLIQQDITLESIDSKVLFALSPVVRVDHTENVGKMRVYRDDRAIYAVDPPAGQRKYTVLSARQSPPPADPLARPPARYLAVPPGIRDVLRREADRVAPPDRYPTPLARAQAMVTYFHSGRLGYSLTYQGSPDAEPVTEFLTVTREGHCELFASAMALMLRTIGIHSRVVNGFRGGEWNALGEFIMVRQQDAHSWVEAYIPGQGWRVFDPTPGAALAGPGRRRTFGSYVSQVYDYVRYSWTRHVMQYDARQQRAVLRRVGDLVALGRTVTGWNRSVVARAWRSWLAGLRNVGGRVGLRGRFAEVFITAVSGLIVLAVGAVLVVVVRRVRRRQQAETPVAFYNALLTLLTRFGYRRDPAQTPMEFAVAVAAADPACAVLVPWMTEQYYRTRFGGRALSQAERSRIDAGLAELGARR